RLPFVSVWEPFGVHALGPGLAHSVVEGFSIRGWDSDVAAVARDLFFRAAGRRHAADFKPPGTFRCEVNPTSVVRPARDCVIRRTRGQRPRGTAARIHYQDIPAAVCPPRRQMRSVGHPGTNAASHTAGY